jgi:cytidylate kinase
MQTPKNIITISQEEGSGGREIARYLAYKLKLRLVDETFIQMAYRNLGITDEEFGNFDEKVLPRLTEFVATLNPPQDYYLSEVLAPDRPGFDSAPHQTETIPPTRPVTPRPAAQELVRSGYQKLVENLIREIAAHGKVVFLDLGANLVLENFPQVLNLRVIAPFEERVERVALTRQLSQEAAATFLREHDYQQEVYVRKFFGPTCANPALYHLVVNTTNISLPALTESLYKFVKEYEGAYHRADTLAVHRRYSRLVDQESYTLDEAAHLLWVDPDVLRKAVYLGELKGKVLEGNRIRLSHQALVDWMQGQHLHARFEAKN